MCMCHVHVYVCMHEHVCVYSWNLKRKYHEKAYSDDKLVCDREEVFA